MDNMDSIEVRIPDEIRVYKEKYGGFTFRQWIGIVLVVVVCIPTYYFLLKSTVQTFAMIVTTLLAAPIGLIFFVPINGMNADKMLPYFKRMFVDFGMVLKFQTSSERELEKELMKDKKYQKKMKKLKKLEKKNQKRIERGSAIEENEQLRAYRADVDEYYNALRKEKIDSLISSKINDVSVGVSPKERKRLRKESESLKREDEKTYLTEDEYGYSIENKSQDGEYGSTYQANSLTSSLEDKKSFEMQDGGLRTSDNTTLNSFYSDSIPSNSQSLSSDESFLSKPNVECDARQDDVYSSDDVEYTKQMQLEDRNAEDRQDSFASNDSSLQNSTEIGSSQGMSKRQKVLQFYRTHPGATMADCKAVTGVEMRTIRRCWPKG